MPRAPGSTWRRAAVVGVAAAALTGCQNYLRPLEPLGSEPEDLLVERMSGARNAQTNAKEQFGFAFANLAAVANAEAPDIDAAYVKLLANYRVAEARADALRDRMGLLRDAEDAAFERWSAALADVAPRGAEDEAERRIADARSAYREVLEAIARAHLSTAPVLALYAEQLRALEAQPAAVGLERLRRDLEVIEERTRVLLDELDESVAASEAFLVRVLDAPGSAVPDPD